MWGFTGQEPEDLGAHISITDAGNIAPIQLDIARYTHKGLL